jgi:hypothetical protein
MRDLFHSLGRFLRRAFKDLPGSIGSNHLGIWFPVLPAALFFFYQGAQNGWRGMRNDLLVATGITVISYGLLFLYCLVRNLYREHVALVVKEKNTREQLEWIQQVPRWEGYESEAAWIAAIDEQNRLVNLGHFADGVLNELQINALRYVKGLMEFVSNELESFPEQGDPARLSLQEMNARLDVRRAWTTRVEYAYKLRFEPEENKLILRFGERNIRIKYIPSKPGYQLIHDRLRDTAAAIVSAVHEVDGIHVGLKVE